MEITKILAYTGGTPLCRVFKEAYRPLHVNHSPPRKKIKKGFLIGEGSEYSDRVYWWVIKRNDFFCNRRLEEQLNKNGNNKNT